MPLLLVKRIKSDDRVDILLVSATSVEMAKKTLEAVFHNDRIEIPAESSEEMECLFNEQYGGIAVLKEDVMD